MQTHIPALHVVLVALQVVPQHGWFRPPQAAHVFVPLLHVVPEGQAVPLVQQAAPAAMPQPVHMPVLALQLAAPAVHVELAQQGWLTPPHILHAPPTHAVPEALHELPAQHGSSLPPQWAHDPPEHTVVAAEQALPLQHG